MIEQAMAFALGFALAGLIALAVAPAFWRRALRLTRRRLELTTPLSMEEIAAGRDALRARFAVERRALEQAADRLKARRGADMIEFGRKTMEMAALRASHEALAADRAAQERALAETRRLLAETRAECAAALVALHGADGLAEARAHERDTARAALAEAQTAQDAAEENEILRRALKDLGAAVVRAAAGEAPESEATRSEAIEREAPEADRRADAAPAP